MIQKIGEQMKNTKEITSSGNQRSSRRTFCHNSLNAKLIFINVLPHDSHLAGDTLIYTSGSVVYLSPAGPSLFTMFIPHPSTVFLSLSSSEIICLIVVTDFTIIYSNI